MSDLPTRRRHNPPSPRRTRAFVVRPSSGRRPAALRVPSRRHVFARTDTRPDVATPGRVSTARNTPAVGRPGAPRDPVGRHGRRPATARPDGCSVDVAADVAFEAAHDLFGAHAYLVRFST